MINLKQSLSNVLLLATILLFSPQTHAASGNDIIKIAGSSTVYPFVTLAAEEFAIKNNRPVPVVESTGTGGGFKLFCEQNSKIDIVNASRAITDKEREDCAKNNHHNIVEIQIGYDAIAIVKSNHNILKDLKFTTKHLFLALANEVEIEGKLVKNPYHYWSDINPSFPKTKISFYGPSVTSGTRESFAHFVMLPNCLKYNSFKQKYQNSKNLELACTSIRSDGVYVDVGENDNVTIGKLQLSRIALGILGFGYYQENYSIITALSINNILPTSKTASDGTYPISRPLYLYTDRDIIHRNADVQTLLKEITSPEAVSADGYLSEIFLIPLKPQEQQYYRNLIDHL